MSIAADSSSCSTCALEASSSTAYAPGEATSRSKWHQIQSLMIRDAANIVRTITSAVKYLHNQGIVHRGQFGEK